MFVNLCVSACKFAFVEIHTAKSVRAQMRVCTTYSPARAPPAARLSLDRVLSVSGLPPMQEHVNACMRTCACTRLCGYECVCWGVCVNVFVMCTHLHVFMWRCAHVHFP
jgi:hypothetical protein